MIHLLTRPTGRTSRTLAFVSRAVRSVAGLVVEQAPVAQQATQAPDPADAYTDVDMPELADVETAAASYAAATDQARAADRGKRAARKILGRLPAGRYGAWLVERVASNRQTADLDAIRATYKRLGLGDVPMKASAPSLRVTRAAAVETDAEQVLTAAA